MKLKTEISDIAEPEIIIKCAQRTPKIRQIEELLESMLQPASEMALTLGETEYYIPKKDILFFETNDGKITAHTAKRMFYTEYKLYELERIMPKAFARVSKSCIVNIDQVSAIHSSITGSGEVLFKNSEKKVYASRAYFKILKDKIYEMRFNQ